MDSKMDTVMDFGWFEGYLDMFTDVHRIAALHSVLNSM